MFFYKNMPHKEHLKVLITVSLYMFKRNADAEQNAFKIIINRVNDYYVIMQNSRVCRND